MFPGTSMFIFALLTFFANTVTALGPAPVSLGTAGNFAVLAKSGVATVPASAITGAVGVSPAAGTFLTGFAVTLAADGVSSSSAQVTGKLYAANYKSPTPSTLTTAISDMLTAYTDAAGRVNPDSLDLGAGGMGGLTLAPGLYKWTSAVNIATDLTLSGGPADVFIFQIAGTLRPAAGVKVILAGGALPKNIFWQVAGAVTVASTAHLEGTLLGRTGITFQTGSSINGRILAQTAMALQKATVVEA